jgi:hypothetical protein
MTGHAPFIGVSQSTVWALMALCLILYRCVEDMVVLVLMIRVRLMNVCRAINLTTLVVVVAKTRWNWYAHPIQKHCRWTSVGICISEHSKFSAEKGSRIEKQCMTMKTSALQQTTV